MPKIAQYDAGENIGLRPSEVGISAVAGAARRLQGDYSEKAAAIADTGQRFGRDIAAAGDVAVKYLDHQQISSGSRSLAGLVAGKTQEWNDAAKNADPNDPTVARRFLDENLEPSLEQFKSGFITENSQKWAESHADQFRQHMFAKTTADMSTLAGEAAKLNHRQTVNGLASAAYNDPSSLDFAIKTLESTTAGVVGSSPNLTGTAAAKVSGELLQTGKEQIIKSAIMGMITRNPNVDLDAIQKKYGEYISGAEIGMFAKAAKVQAKSDLLADKQIATYEIQLAERSAHAAANKNFTDNVSIDPATNMPIIKPAFFQGALDIAKNNSKAPNAATIAKTYLDWGEAQQKKERVTVDKQDIRDDLYKRMGDPTNPTTEIQILRAETTGGITRQTSNDFLKLQKAINERPEGESIRRSRDKFEKTFSRVIDGMMNDMGTHSVLGAQRMYEFQMDARRQEQALLAKGDDPNKVYDPRSEYFFGRPENIQKYRVSMQEAQEYENLLKTIDKKKDSMNLTGDNKAILGVDVQDMPKFGDRKQFNENGKTVTGVWNGSKWVPAKVK